MDFFSRLPATIRIQILIDLGSPACISRLIKASPTMLQQYTVHRHIIVREVLRELTSLDKTGGLLQDAMALLYLAELDPKLYTRQKQRRLCTLFFSSAPEDKEEADFLRHYKEQNFPNPLDKNSEKPTQLRVYRLIRQMIIRIKDYKINEDCSQASRMWYPFRNPSPELGRPWLSHEYEMRLGFEVPPRVKSPANDPEWIHQLHQSRGRDVFF
ncbi:hypothetical protein F52700_5301 [Fusarium sp. NRRL 52700]|nr:hypothetical protein F52700_5301 [Fusarium sp. NRRL 52700]